MLLADDVPTEPDADDGELDELAKLPELAGRTDAASIV